MKRLIKLGVLLLISTSCYFIYKGTRNSAYIITNIGDRFSQGMNSYGIKEYSYIDYYQETLEHKKNKVITNQKYSKENQTIYECLILIKETPDMKRVLYDSDSLVITLGYNDLLYYLSTEEKMNSYKLNRIIKQIKNNYDTFIEEIQKYYHEQIIVIGYMVPKTNDNYRKEGIKKLNKILEENKNITFIDTENLLKRKELYYDNPNSYYPNSKAYKEIGKKIISKTLEK